MVIQRISKKLVKTSDSGIFHDSRKDVRLISDYVNKLVDKLNEVIDENNRLREIIDRSTNPSLNP